MTSRTSFTNAASKREGGFPIKKALAEPPTPTFSPENLPPFPPELKDKAEETKKKLEKPQKIRYYEAVEQKITYEQPKLVYIKPASSKDSTNEV
ncbi:hypothetical protein BDN70DRAFT_933855 [Pholiota conissans]|uniref:Uncharacterized protein n=1 Tax=Pholiota conissans TaxID=109636 RepID=A0A9P5YZ59_9AGAR|nr:hypothetical protein BDN70DRAFT_933855 [Pholiota conissans]